MSNTVHKISTLCCMRWQFIKNPVKLQPDVKIFMSNQWLQEVLLHFSVKFNNHFDGGLFLILNSSWLSCGLIESKRTLELRFFTFSQNHFSFFTVSLTFLFLFILFLFFVYNSQFAGKRMPRLAAVEDQLGGRASVSVTKVNKNK